VLVAAFCGDELSFNQNAQAMRRRPAKSSRSQNAIANTPEACAPQNESLLSTTAFESMNA